MLLQKRANTYYFRWVFPPHIRSILDQREIYKSLRTPCVELAQARSSRYYRFVHFVKGLDVDTGASRATISKVKKLASVSG